jgi:hypothetical protein
VAQFELVTTELGQRRPPVPPGLQLAVLRAANDLAYYGEKRTLGARAGRQAGKVSADLKGLSAECR